MRTVSILITLCGLVPSPTLRADEWKLTGGRVIVGEVVKQDARLEIRTRTGTVIVEAADVISHRTDAELRAELRRLADLAGDSAIHEVELARTAFEFGLTASMWKHLDRCFEQITAEDRGARRRCQILLAQLEPEVLPASLREKVGKHRVRGMLRLANRQSSRAKQAAIVELLVHEQGADDELRHAAHNEGNPEQRMFALEALARRPVDENVVALCKAIVIDEERDVRVATAHLVAEHGDAADVVRRVAPGLLSDHPSMRGRTAQALEYLGHEEAVPYLVAAGPAANLRRAPGGGSLGVRAHMFQRTERAYIRDFEVEIAQAAAVANPIIGTASSGVVLDVRVGGVFGDHGAVLTSYRNALIRIVGSDPGPDPLRWQAWWDAHRHRDAAPSRPTTPRRQS